MRLELVGSMDMFEDFGMTYIRNASASYENLKNSFLAQMHYKLRDRVLLFYIAYNRNDIEYPLGHYIFLATRVQQNVWSVFAAKEREAKLVEGKVLLNQVANEIKSIDPNFKSVIAFIEETNKPSKMAVSAAGWQRCGRLTGAGRNGQDMIIYEHTGGENG